MPNSHDRQQMPFSAPGLANAAFAASGQRLGRLPLWLA